MAIENRAFEAGDVAVAFAAGVDQVREVLVDEPVGADDFLDLLDAAAGGDELGGGGHVDAIDVGEADRRRRRGEVDLAGAGVPGHLDDLFRGGAAHNRIIDEQHVLAAKLEVNDIELLPHRFPALGLAGHDEGAADVAVLDEALAELDAKPVGELKRDRAARLGDRDDDVDVLGRAQALELVGELLPHAQPRLVNRDAIHQRIRPGEIDMLEDAGCVDAGLDADPGVHFAGEIEVNRLAGGDIALDLEALRIEGHRFRGDHVLAAALLEAAAEHQRADAVWIAKTNDTVAGDHHDHGVGAAATHVHAGDRGEDVFRGGRHLAPALQFMGENVEQHFGIGIGVDMAQIVAEQVLAQFAVVGEIAVVGEGEAVGGIDIQRLGQGRAAAAGGGVAHVGDAHLPGEPPHVAGAENILDQAVVLAQIEFAAVAGHDAGGILAAVLQHRQGVIQAKANILAGNNPNQTTHDSTLPPSSVAAGHYMTIPLGVMLCCWLRSLSGGDRILTGRACHPWRERSDFDWPQSRHPWPAVRPLKSVAFHRLRRPGLTRRAHLVPDSQCQIRNRFG